MKISYHWLTQYVQSGLSPEEISTLLTGCGLEVENIESYDQVKGGLKGLVVGEVQTKIKHPGADRLSVTTVDTGSGSPLLQIVCGAPNVDVGQKVIVATVGTTLYPSSGDPFEIKKSKIRGEVSEGMICAEDEIGMGASHEGIMVLDPCAKAGTPAAEYFQIEHDFVFEIGLTPNRADAASHLGVARDLVAVLQNHKTYQASFRNPGILLPPVDTFRPGHEEKKIDVVVEDTTACPRYTGVTLSSITVKESPQWLQNRLKAIGVRPINNIVDITNYVLHETGQPLHAFDADKIKGNKIIVKKLPQGTKFTTLDEKIREVSDEDLMICDTEGGLCIAGVFGGLHSGVTSETKNIFLESACFNPVHIRKTARRHDLKTDAAFRFERGTDPNGTLYALKRAALLMQELANGTVASGVEDVYPSPVEDAEVLLSYRHVTQLIGISIDKEDIKKILRSLDIKIKKETTDNLVLAIPPFRIDVKREEDVIEEILRIYGYNNVPVSGRLHLSVIVSKKPDVEKLRNVVSGYLSNNGFHEIMSNSLTRSAYKDIFPSIVQEDKFIRILNPLSSDLDVMRQHLLPGALEIIAYNRNRQKPDLALYEFGKTYTKEKDVYRESSRLALFTTGRRASESVHAGQATGEAGFFYLKSFLQNTLLRTGLTTYTYVNESPRAFSTGLSVYVQQTKVAEIGIVEKNILAHFAITDDVYCAYIDWDAVIVLLTKEPPLQFTPLPRFPEVRRDLSLLLDKAVKYADIEALAWNTEKHLLKEVTLFDNYEGDKIAPGKKSYALRFVLQDEQQTLTEHKIEKTMEKLMDAFEKKLGAAIRK